MEIPVYLFTGFLEAGKTKFITETLHDPNFNDKSRPYLLICCEEGEEEYDPAEMPENVKLASFDEEQMLTPDRISAMQKRAGAEIIVIEYNGMWSLDSIYNALPENFKVFQEIFIADSTTILNYNANMRQLVVDKLSSAEMVVFNRYSEAVDKMALHKLVRGVSRRANICYEDLSGELAFDDIQDPLPYDLNAANVVINDEDFAIFYRDMTEEPEKYFGKTLTFKGIVALDKSLPSGQFAIGRHVMTCCVDDISFSGLVCNFDRDVTVKTGEWVMITAKIRIEAHKLYGSEGPVLYATDVAMTSEPKQPVATFY